MTDGIDKAREEFFSEAQELIEMFSRNLLALDEQGIGAADPSIINEAFRAVHTLKSLAGLFNATEMGRVSHTLEDVLDRLRLGRLKASPDVLDVLFAAVDCYGAMLAAERGEEGLNQPQIEKLMGVLGTLGESAVEEAPDQMAFDLEPGLLAVLTEYEEHRLKTNMDAGQALFRIRVRFDLATIDKALEDVKAKAKPHGEIITYLPTGDAPSADAIELDLLMASSSSLEQLEAALGGTDLTITAIPRISQASASTGISSLSTHALGTSSFAAVGEETAGSTVAVGDNPRTEPPVNAELNVPAVPMLRSVADTVRVDIRKLDGLMNVVGELAIVKSALNRLGDRLRNTQDRELRREVSRIQRSFERRLSELQDGILEVRMVTLGQLFDRLSRVVRQISRDMGKEIRLVVTGAQTEIDKLLVEELGDPLMHIIRNSIDHGIESAEQRKAIGKPVAGTIALNAYQKGNHVVIQIEDDGQGVNEAAVVERAVRAGHLAANEVEMLSRAEALGLIFLPGLSTREQAGEYSGRGVGMDIVKTNINKLGGIIDIQSEYSIGTQLVITLPITLAIVNALLIRLLGRTFALPLSSVAEALMFDEKLVRTVDGREVMTLRGSTLVLCRLDRFFELKEPALPHEGPRYKSVVVATMGARRLGLVVDDLLGQQDIVVKGLGPTLRHVRGFAGASELGDQRVALVLDAGAIIEEALAGHDAVTTMRARPS
ncbi:MAG: chemotaxis protein CheA [Polyangiaceae bacterium]|nr:chemotaxis protein CheA [Polyangiaceae bacterium]